MSAILVRVYPQAALAAFLTAVACTGAHPAGQKPGETESVLDAGSSAPNRDEAPAQGEGVAPSSDRLLVETHAGKVRGISTDGVDRFLGIPYAAPPVGELRLAPTTAPDHWTDVLEAHATRSKCPQLVNNQVEGNEDCLYLNVYRPAAAEPASALPVAVWIHGGDFRLGAGSEYNPQRLVTTNDIIVVTINYRLGPLGFVAADGPAGGDGLTGDYGLQDQVAALRWVQANIGAFGGAADQVTIQGESAGGTSVCALVASPFAAGAFSRAIIQSASCASMPVDYAKSRGGALANELKCTSDPTSCLRSTSLDRLVRTSEQLKMPYGPVAGNATLPSAPFEAIVRQEYRKVPVLIGGITDEMSFFMSLDTNLLYTSPWQNYPALLATWFPNLKPEDRKAIETEYPLSRYGNDPKTQSFLALSAVLNDSGVYYKQALGGCVTAKVATAFSQATSTYSYELDDPSFTWKGGNKGASHTTDLPYLFDLTNPLNEAFDEDQSRLAHTMVLNWGAFISGEPPSSSWPPYGTAKLDSELADTQYFKPGAGEATINLRVRHHCAFWEKLCGSQSKDCPYPKR